MKEKSKSTVYSLILCALFAALIAVGAFIKIPVPFVPFTLQLLFTTLAGIVLGPKYGALFCWRIHTNWSLRCTYFLRRRRSRLCIAAYIWISHWIFNRYIVTGLIVHKVPRPSTQTSLVAQLFSL